MLTLLIVFVCFIGVTAFVVGVASFLPGSRDSGVEDRLAMLTGATSRKEKNEQLDLLVKQEDHGSIGEVLQHYFNLQRLLDQADVSMNPTRFGVVCAVVAALSAGACLVAPIPKAAAPAMAVLGGLLPWAWLLLKRKARLSAFAKQLPEALELIARALRAGHSLAAGISLVAEEMKAPICKEFGRCYEEQNLGVPLEEALENMTERVPNLDFRFFATAVILQRQTGGDLAEILDKIGHLIRERFRIWGQVQALTGEGRLSGIVLLAMPPALFVVMYVMNPDYCMMLFRDPLGQKMLVVAIIMQIVGALVIRKIVNIKV